MTACPHCQRTLPSDLSGTNCPACKKALPLAVVRSANPTFTETPALGQARPVARPAQPTHVEDRWDDAGSEPSKPTGVPTSAGLPGAVATTRRGGATQVMGSDEVFAAEKRDAIGPAAARVAGERETNDVAASTGERAAPKAAEKPVSAGLPGATPRGRGQATIVGGSPLLAPTPSVESAASPSIEDNVPVATRRDDEDDETSALRVDQLEKRVPGDVPSDRPPARPATTADAPVDLASMASASGSAPASESAAIAPATTGIAAVPKSAPAPAKGATSTPNASAISSASGPRPVLASEMLREDLVPHEPARQALRVVLALAGVVLVTLAAMSMRDPAQAIAWAIPGLTSLAVVLAPASYGTRALLPFAPASAALLMQAIAVPGTRIPAAVVFTITAGGLPAALFYRSFFRASRRARAFVAVGLLAAVVWLQLPGGGALFESGQGSWAMAHIPALALIGVSLLSLLAFVGADTTAGCRAWASLAIAWAGFATLAQRTVLAGASFDRDAWSSALATSALAAVTALSGAALLALYSRPTAPRTGIGAAASQH